MRLKMLRPRVSALKPRLAKRTDSEGHSKTAEPLRRLYSTVRWKRLRVRVFNRDNFTCQCGCGEVEGRSQYLVADHRKPHRGDLALFWDEANVWTLRKPCHDAWKQRQEAASRRSTLP